jgi:uncharacterized protein
MQVREMGNGELNMTTVCEEGVEFFMYQAGVLPFDCCCVAHFICRMYLAAKTPIMRLLFNFISPFILLSASAQTAPALQKHREQYKADLAKDIKADTSKVSFYPFKKEFIITASVEKLDDQPVFPMITSSGMKKEARKFVKVTFRFKEKSYTLYGYQLTRLKESTEYADHFFIPFKDETTGNATYAAGRYLDFKAGDVTNGKLVMDFNKAYNPYCAFTDGYNCPIPPKENTLKMAVAAGEKKYLGTHISK